MVQLPYFVMLEMKRLKNNNLQLSIVDKCHNDILDCEERSVPKRFVPKNLRSWIDSFKNDLKNCGVI